MGERARERGLPAETAEDLADALFVDGLSTPDAVDEISGRGIGMAAVKQAVVRLGGAVRVHSTLGVVTAVVPASSAFGATQVGATQVGATPRP